MKTIPCENCITMVICRQEILNNINFPVSYLQNKCRLFDNFINTKVGGAYPGTTKLYGIIEVCFQLNFKIEEEQKNKFKKLKQSIEKENHPNENSL